MDRGPAVFIERAEHATDIFLFVLASIPLGFTAPVILAFFAAIKCVFILFWHDNLLVKSNLVDRLLYNERFFIST